jgi:hypothetical protein
MMLRTRQGPDCASHLIFDRWQAGELPPDEIAKLEAHLAACPRCSERRDALLGNHEVFDVATPDWLRDAAREPAGAEPILTPPSARSASPLASVSRGARWLPVGASVVALAAVIFLVVRSRQSGSIDERERLKGGATLGYHVKHDGIVREGTAGEALAPGDAVQFSYSANRSGHLAVFSVDGAKRASTYWPRGERATPVTLGRDVSLPESIVLDDVLGPETIYALLCAEPVLVEPIRSELERFPEREPRVEGCTTERLGFVKVPR